MCRQLQDQETGRSVVAPRDLRELMAVLPNIDLSDTLEIPRVFRCDEQTLPCDHTSRYQSITGWCNNLRHPEWGKSLRAFVRLLPPAYNDGKIGLLDDCFRTEREGWRVTACHATPTFLDYLVTIYLKVLGLAPYALAVGSFDLSKLCAYTSLL
jgi:hypothetical protein